MLRREIAALVVGNGHGGKPQQLSQGRVVKARDGHIFGNAHARLAEGAHGPDGHVVIRADQRLGQPLANQQQLCRLVTAFFAVIAGQVAFGVKGDAVFLQHIRERLVALPVIQRIDAAQKRIVAIALPDQPLYQLAHGRIVVDQQALDVGFVHHPVQGHDGIPLLGLALEQLIVAALVQHDAAAGEALGHEPVARSAGADDQVVLAGIDIIADTMNDLEVKLAVKIAEVEQDGLAFTAFEGAARVVDLIIHFLADAQHAFARAVADVFPAVEHVGDRRRGNACRLCDILDDYIHSYAPLNRADCRAGTQTPDGPPARPRCRHCRRFPPVR